MIITDNLIAYIINESLAYFQCYHRSLALNRPSRPSLSLSLSLQAHFNVALHRQLEAFLPCLNQPLYP